MSHSYFTEPVVYIKESTGSLAYFMSGLVYLATNNNVKFPEYATYNNRLVDDGGYQGYWLTALNAANTGGDINDSVSSWVPVDGQLRAVCGKADRADLFTNARHIVLGYQKEDRVQMAYNFLLREQKQRGDWRDWEAHLEAYNAMFGANVTSDEFNELLGESKDRRTGVFDVIVRLIAGEIPEFDKSLSDSEDSLCLMFHEYTDVSKADETVKKLQDFLGNDFISDPADIKEHLIYFLDTVELAPTV